jgi:hypothetical protein
MKLTDPEILGVSSELMQYRCIMNAYSKNPCCVEQELAVQHTMRKAFRFLTIREDDIFSVILRIVQSRSVRPQPFHLNDHAIISCRRQTPKVQPCCWSLCVLRGSFECHSLDVTMVVAANCTEIVVKIC